MSKSKQEVKELRSEGVKEGRRGGVEGSDSVSQSYS